MDDFNEMYMKFYNDEDKTDVNKELDSLHRIVSNYTIIM